MPRNQRYWRTNRKRVNRRTFVSWNKDRAEEALCLHGHSGPVLCLAMSSDGRRLVSGGSDNTVRVWEAVTGVELRQCHMPDYLYFGPPAYALAFYPDDHAVLGVGYGVTTCVWDITSGRVIRTVSKDIHSRRQAPRSVAFIADGRNIVIGQGFNEVAILDASSLSEKWVLRVSETRDGSITAVAALRDKSIVTASQDRTLRIWDTEEAKARVRLRGSGDARPAP